MAQEITAKSKRALEGAYGDDATADDVEAKLNEAAQTKQVTVTSAEILALNATPKELVAAPGANKAIVVEKVVLYHAGGTAYAGIAAGEDWAFKYTNGSGAEAAPQVETTGFLDDTGAQTRYVVNGNDVGAVGDVVPAANAALVLHQLVGEITTGDFDVLVKVWYTVVDTVLS